MATPLAHAQINAYQGDTPDDLNQELGTQAFTVVWDSASPVLSPLSQQFVSMQPLYLSSSNELVSVSQPLPLTGSITQVVLPLSIASGDGMDVLVGLYADSAGQPVGAPITQVFVPKESQVSPSVSGGPANLAYPIGGSWVQATSPFPIAGGYYGFGYVQSPTNVFIFGGSAGASFYSSSWLADIDTQIEPWQQTASPYPVTVYNLGACYCAGYAVSAGGETSANTSISDVYVATLDSNGPGAWTQQPSLPVTLQQIAVATDGVSNVYVIGGRSLTAGSGTTRTAIYQATLTSSGQINTWQTVGNLPTALSCMAAIGINGWLVMIGGCDDTADPTGTGVSQTKVYGAPILPSGALGAIIPFPSYPDTSGFGIQSPQVAAAGDTLMIVGEVLGSGVGDICYTLTVTPEGPAQSWVTQSGMGIFNGTQGLVMLSNGSSFTAIALVGSTPALPATYQMSGEITPTISVPLIANGLSGNYHIVVTPVGQFNNSSISQLALSSVNPTGTMPSSMQLVGTGAV